MTTARYLDFLTGYDLHCTKCAQEMTRWPDENYYRCRECGTTVTVTEKPRSTTPAKPQRSVVYFLRTGNRVKIGRTTNLPGRIASLSLEPACCVLAIDGAARVESELHRRFAPYRIHRRREWFDWTDDIARYVEEHQPENVKKQAMRCWIP